MHLYDHPVGYTRQKAFRKSDDLNMSNMWATEFAFPLCLDIFDFYFCGFGHSLVQFRLQKYLV